MPTNKCFVIAIDNNPASSQALTYCGMLFSSDQHVTFQLIHCLSQSTDTVVPETLNPESSLLPDIHTSSSRKMHAETILHKGAEFLAHKGISRDRITTSVVAPRTSLDQAIISFAGQVLSDCIIVARRGIGYVGEMILGSVSVALFRKSHAVPLWIIDGEVSSRNILVAVDGSVHSLRAIDHISHVLENRNDISIYLYHCAAFLAPDIVCNLATFYSEWGRTWCDTHLSGNGCLFNGPAQLLLESGIPQEQIKILPETSHLAESTSIISQAKKHHCGTIVIGRRGPDSQKGFFGGISNSTIRKTQNMAIWIVG